MPFAASDVRRGFTSKLGFEVDAGKKHVVFTRRHGGRVLGITHMSHGKGKDLPEFVINKMAGQLGVSGPHLRGALSCSLQPEAFLALLLAVSTKET